MEAVILVVHLFLALAIIGLVLLQRSEGGGLGIGGGSGGGLGNLATARGVGNILTRATAICAFAFFCTSLALGVLARAKSEDRHSIYDALENSPPAVEQTIDKAPDKIEIGEDGGAEGAAPPAVPIAE
jgi:preprotein translocase subunit SecG